MIARGVCEVSIPGDLVLLEGQFAEEYNTPRN